MFILVSPLELEKLWYEWSDYAGGTWLSVGDDTLAEFKAWVLEEDDG